MSEEILDYEEVQTDVPEAGTAGRNDGQIVASKGTYAGMHSSTFRDFLLKPELLQAITDCGFEHPSEVQHECIPQAMIGGDVLCQAKSGMGKTAVFVLAILQQFDTEHPSDLPKVIVLGHTRELAYQISNEFERFSKHLSGVRIAKFYGGIPVQENIQKIKDDKPNIVVGTPGRILQLINDKHLDVSSVAHFVLDECDKMLEQEDMRNDVQRIFMKCNSQKQVMMYTATLPANIRNVAKRFMKDPMEIFVDDESKLTLHGLMQHYMKIPEKEKNRKLFDLLDKLEFNQVVIFVRSCQRAKALAQLLQDNGFPTIDIHADIPQADRIMRYSNFKAFHHRILVATDVMGRGIDIERVNIVFNYDMPHDSDSYLHRVGRAGRFGTKGLAITFSSTESDEQVLSQVQNRFAVSITPLPDMIEVDSYMNA